MTSPAFRAYFIDHRNHVREIASIEADTVDAACAQAGTLLANTGFAAVEIWEGPRIVGRQTGHRWSKVLWPFGKHSDETA